jgi:hypothetical protein
MKRKKKMLYISPSVNVLFVVLEGNIALHSPIEKILLRDRTEEDRQRSENNSDPWLDL